MSEQSTALKLDGKVALVANAGSHLGLGIVTALVEDGAAVAVAGRAGDGPEIGALAESAGGRIVDLGQSEAGAEQARGLVASAVTALKTLDILVIVPVPFAPGPILEQSPKVWQGAIDLNVAGGLYLAQAAARQMKEQGGGGRIIFISSVASEMPFHETALMGTTLAAANTVAQVAALELGQYGITVNIVAPGWLETASDDTLSLAAPVNGSGRVERRAYVERAIPLGRPGAAAEVGQVVAFLASGLAAYVNGAYIKVDGGFAISASEGGTPYPGKEPWPSFEAGYDPFNAGF